MPTIGERVKRLREGRLISQRQLAEEVGVKQPTIANIEGGRTKQIKGYVLEKLAEALNTTTSYILTGDKHQGAADEAAIQAELVGIWKKLPEPYRTTLLQTARGLLKAAEVTPPTLKAPQPKRLPAAKETA